MSLLGMKRLRLLWVYCCECYHERDVNPATVPLPPQTPVPEVGKHMKCSACGKSTRDRSCTLAVSWRCANAYGISQSPEPRLGTDRRSLERSSEKNERRRGAPALKVVCSGVGTAVGCGGRPTLPINLRLSRKDCSQGKYSLHRVTQGRLLILPWAIRPSPSPANANCTFHGTLNWEGACWLNQGWLHGRISNETSRTHHARSFSVQRNYPVRAGRSRLGRWQTRGSIPGVELG